MKRFQTNGIGDVVKLRFAHIIQSFSSPGELFIDLDCFFRHLLMCFLSAADEPEILTRGDPLMTVRVKSDPQKHVPRGSLAVSTCHIRLGYLLFCSSSRTIPCVSAVSLLQ